MRPPVTRADMAARTADLSSLSDPGSSDALIGLLRLLYAVGRHDLPLGRLFEGHVDALQILTRYGTPAQRAKVEAAAHGGAAFGVWNADLPGEPLVIAGDRLSGAKAFASGAGLLSHALVSVDSDGGRQLILLDLAHTPPIIDRFWWRVTGMQRSETHLIRWDAALILPDARIGEPGNYIREPFFSGGAIRFAAVQAGGIAGVVDGSVITWSPMIGIAIRSSAAVSPICSARRRRPQARSRMQRTVGRPTTFPRRSRWSQRRGQRSIRLERRF